MPFHREEKFAVEVGSAYGEYLTTFVSEPDKQVRVDIFRTGKRVVAHVSFSTGVDASDVTDPYVAHFGTTPAKKGSPITFN